MPIVLKSGSLNLLEPSGPVQACNGIALPLPLPEQIVMSEKSLRSFPVFVSSLSILQDQIAFIVIVILFVFRKSHREYNHEDVYIVT